MEIVDNKCSSCKASLEYNIKTQNWKCKHCRKEYGLDEIKQIKHKTKKSINELICPTCHAKLLTNENIISTKCVYCRNDVIVNKTTDKISMPDKIIPFRVSKNEAKNIFKKLIKERKLAPEDLEISEINGLYVPFWLYTNKYKVSMRNKGTVMKKAQVEFNYIPFDANKHLDNKVTSSIEPFDYNDLVDFDTAYLAGFIAQKYDVEAEEGQKKIQDRCAMTIEEIFTRPASIHYVPKIDLVHETIIDSVQNYALFPLWLIHVKYKGEKFVIAINGQTGSSAGEIPIVAEKYYSTGFIVLIIIFLLLLLISLVLRWGGLL